MGLPLGMDIPGWPPESERAAMTARSPRMKQRPALFHGEAEWESAGTARERA